jgi:hypothetical protein
MFLQRVVLVVVVVVVVSRGFFTYRFTRFFSSSFSLFSSSSSWWWCSLFFLVPVVVFLQRVVGFFLLLLLLLLSLPSDRHALVLQTTKRASFFVFAFARVVLCRRELGAFFRSRHLSVFKSCEEKGETFSRARADRRSIIRLIIYVFDSYSI